MKEWIIIQWTKIVEFFKSEWFITNIKEIGLWLLGIIATIVVTKVANKVINWLKTITKNEKTKHLLNKAQEIINKCCDTTTQTIVDTAKKSKAFTPEKQKQALTETLESSKKLLTKDLKDAIKTEYGNIEEYIKLQIESHIHEEKASKK